MSDEVAPVATEPAPAAVDTGGGRIDTVAQAMEELDRRDAARKAAKAAAKAAPAADAEEDTGDDAEEAPLAKKAKPAPKVAAADEDSDDETESDDEEDAEVEPDEDAEAHSKAKKADKATTADDDSIDYDKDGKKYRIPAALKDDLLRQSDYTRKTQDVAQERTEVQQAKQQASQTLAQLQQAQATLVQMAQSMLGQPPALELAQHDPQSYLVQRGLYEQRLAAMQQITGQGQQLTRQQQQGQAQAQQERLKEEARLMIQHMPDLAVPAKRAAFMADAVDAAAEYGFTANDVAAIDDHRMLRLLSELVTLRKRGKAAQTAEASVRTKLANVPPKMLKSGGVNGDDMKSNRRTDVLNGFKRSGRTMKDVSRALAALGD